MVSDIFLNNVLYTLSGVFVAILAVLYKSKCLSIKRGSCCEIIRDVQGEEKYDELELQNHQSSGDNNNNNNIRHTQQTI